MRCRWAKADAAPLPWSLNNLKYPKEVLVISLFTSSTRRSTPLAAGVLALGVAALTVGAVTAPTFAQDNRPVSFADLAERLSPAVVNISTAQTVNRPNRPMPQLPPGSPFREFFEDFFDRRGGEGGGPNRVQSLGSGFVIDGDGFVVTNNHVIEEADEIEVNFSDGSSLPAVLIGRDPKTDIALLKVEPPEPLEFVNFGESEAARVGDWVVAIGNPFGLGGSVSAGIISARNRDINAGPYDDFIQTDAAINRGNSGGPLFNMAGEVIGVNTAIISPSGGSIGIGFSVPSAIATAVVEQLRSFGETRRGWLGVRIQSVDETIAESLGLDDAMGALVSEVTEDGPAEEAGLESGDVILTFDGQNIESMRDLPRIVAETEVGKTVDVEILRRGSRDTVQVAIALLEEERFESTEADTAGDDDSTASMLGMVLEPLTPDSRRRFDISS
nr:Do family serine endopeptidase [Paracoccaceae bacterium]